MEHPATSHSALYAANASNGALGMWMAVDVILQHGPGWAMVPPLLIAAASLVGASSGWLDRRQARRHAEERHRAEQRLLLIHGFKPGMERLN